MYETFFDLSVRPFDLTPNPRFLFMTPSHREALSTIEYGISGRKGLTLLVGPAGTGKTTLIHAALERQHDVEAGAIYLTNPTLTREEFFQFLAFEMGISDGEEKSKTVILRELQAALLERRRAGRLTALVVDEAQAMPDELLEELRLLENLETSSEKLLPVVLVGQLELVDRLRQPRLLALKQRIALRSTLSPLSARETAAYMAERIRIAGGDVRQIFTPEAVAAICESSGGVPRNISVICDNAMVAGFALDEKPISVTTIAEVCRDFDLPLPRIAAAPRTADEFVETATALATRDAQSPLSAPRPANLSMTTLQMSTVPPPNEMLVLDVPADELAQPRRLALPRLSLPARVRGLRSLFVRTVPR